MEPQENMPGLSCRMNAVKFTSSCRRQSHGHNPDNSMRQPSFPASNKGGICGCTLYEPEVLGVQDDRQGFEERKQLHLQALWKQYA